MAWNVSCIELMASIQGQLLQNYFKYQGRPLNVMQQANNTNILAKVDVGVSRFSDNGGIVELNQTWGKGGSGQMSNQINYHVPLLSPIRHCVECLAVQIILLEICICILKVHIQQW
ncbi:Hypothetical_protein [Hexamita inflata]|uniref:Hypothetical_protein n=1 Tax=Hexamita inflata TaxID=28002 RepID=A0AA86Q7J4_9EUKA|nr:Hypothetical protein HINF_LOCUS35227 [Hexamita inflata]